MDKQVLEALESLVDAHGLFAVTDLLADVCREKADHLQSNWQDNDTARVWNKAADAIDKAASRILDLAL